MEIDITEFFYHKDPSEFSASIAETGYEDISERTWSKAMEEALISPLLNTEDEINAFRSYVEDFGAWSKEEIETWPIQECNALFIQLISGDIREADLVKGEETTEINWHKYEIRADEGNCSGNIYRSINGKIYYSLTS